MNIILITQNETFCLHKSLSYLHRNLPESFKIKGVALLSPSLLGVKLTPFQKAVSTLKVIELKFIIYYEIKLIASKMSGDCVYNFPREKSNSNLSMFKIWFPKG